MPPKKKKSAKKGKKKGGKDGELTSEDKLKLKSAEIGSLKDNLAFRKDFARQTKAAYEELKSRLEDTNHQIDEIETVHKSASAYLTHQYKSLQNESAIKTHQLETELLSTRKQLEATLAELDYERRDKKRIMQEKDDKIMDLEQKIENIQIAYDSVIQVTMDTFNQRLDQVKLKWENKSAHLQTKNKTLLAELGIRIHDI